MMEKYLMKDWNEVENIGWVLETNCPKNRLEYFVALSHEFGRECEVSTIIDNKVVDFSSCWADYDYLMAMLEHCQYDVKVYEFDYDHIISW